MPKELVNTWNGVKNIQNTLPKDRAEELNTFNPFFSMLTVMGNAADIYDKDGNRLDLHEWQDRIAEQQQKKRSGENVSNDVFYLHSHADESEMYAATVEYGEFNPSVTMNENPIPEEDRDIILVQPQKAKEAEAVEPKEASEKILEAFDAFEKSKATMYPEDREVNWEAATSFYFGFLSNLKDEVNVYDKLGRPLDKEAWQNQIIAKQQNALDGNSVQNDTFYLQSNKNESVRFAMTVAYDGKTPTMTMGKQPLSAREWSDRIAAATTEALAAQKVAAEKARRESAVDRFFAAWKEVEDFKKSPGMEKRGMDIMSTAKLNKVLKTVQEITFVSDKDGNPFRGDMWTSLLSAKQTIYEKGEKVPKETFYLRCKDDISKMFELSVEYGKTQPTFTLNKTPLSDNVRAELTDKWMAKKAANEAAAEAGIDLDDIRARREWIANAPQRLFGAFKGVQDMKKVPNFKRPNVDMATMELRKNLQNVQDVATVCDAAGNKLEGDAWLEHVAAKQLLRASGEKVPKETFYLTCKDDNSKMFKVTVDYSKTKPKFKIDKTPIYEDERWRLRGEWQKNAATQKPAVQAEVHASQENSVEKQNQQEKTAVAVDNVASDFVMMDKKEAELVAEEFKNAPQAAKQSSSMKEMEKAAKDAAKKTEEPSWKKHDVNAQKVGSGVAIEMAELEPLAEAEKAPESALKNFEKEFDERQKERDKKLTLEERDMDRISKKTNSAVNKEIESSLEGTDVDAQERTRESRQSFRRDILDAAKENDSVRTLLANMETSTMQALYAAYIKDMTNGVDPKLKGVLNEAVRMAEVENNVSKDDLLLSNHPITDLRDYHPIPNNEDVDAMEQNRQENQNQQIEQIEDIKINPQIGP